MTLQALNTAIAWPKVAENINAALALNSSTTLDAAGEYEAVVICAREAMAISHAGIYLGAATGSPTMDKRIETVDPATGLPSGTLWAANTNIVTGALGTGWTLSALTATANIAAGDVFALKYAYNSGTSMGLRCLPVGSGGQTGLPYRVTNTGTPTKGAQTNLLAALGSSATAFYFVRTLNPVSAISNNNFDNTNGARRGVRFQVPFKCRAAGIRWWDNTNTGNFNIAIYDDAGTELSSSSTGFDGNNLLNTAAGSLELYFDSPVTLQPDTWYRAVIEPSEAANSNLSVMTCPSSNYLKAMPGGQNYHYTTFASAAWSDTATDQVPLMDILIDQLDDGVGAGAVGVIGG